jgi:predicted SAM-dependent methyltransferase
MSESKVALGWLPSPLGGMQLLQQGFVDSVIAFLSYDSNPAQGRQIFGGYTTAAGGYIPAGRCMLVQAFLDKTDADWLLMLDWDITFMPPDVYKMIDDCDPTKVMCGAYVTYFGDNDLLRPCWFSQREDQEYVPVDSFRQNEIMELTVCGMGFTLMHRELLEHMRDVYSDDPWPWFGHDNINDSRVGEDLTFCTRARKCGATIWGHGGVLLGHTKAKTLHPKDMEDISVARARHTGGRLLNVGGGSKLMPLPSEYGNWEHTLLDIVDDGTVDVVGDATDPATWDDLADFDLIFCSHNLEHYDATEVPTVLACMREALKDGGTIDIRVPDIGEVAEKIGAGANLDDVAYESPSGPIRFKDMMYGYEEAINAGNIYYRHKMMFTDHKLRSVLEDAGFQNIEVKRMGGFELKAIAST